MNYLIMLHFKQLPMNWNDSFLELDLQLATTQRFNHTVKFFNESTTAVIYYETIKAQLKSASFDSTSIQHRNIN